MGTLMSMLPILIFFILPLLSSLFSGSSSGPATPRMVFEKPIPPYTEKRTTPSLGVDYWVKPADVAKWTPQQLGRLDVAAENTRVTMLSNDCAAEKRHKEQLIMDAQGWFFPDEEKLKRAQRYPTPSCKKLDELSERASKRSKS